MTIEITLPSAPAVRLQRSRKKGTRTPPGAIYVGRPTRWGNPFMVARFGHMKAINLHRAWLHGRIAALSLERLGFCPVEIDALFRMRARVLTEIHALAGHSLTCWCPLTSPCHADLLLHLAAQHSEIERLAA